MSEYEEYLRQRVEGLPPLQKVMLELDAALTGHAPTEIVRQYHHYPVSLEHWMQRDGWQFIWYLSDSGYSRVAWSEETGNLALTSNSRQQVKDNWERALPQRQAVAAELQRQWDAMAGPQQEAEDPKQFLQRHAPPKPLPNGNYCVYIKFGDTEERYVPVSMEDGWLTFHEAPYEIGYAVHAARPGLGDEFYDEVGKYTSAIENAAVRGITSGEADGVAGHAVWRIEPDIMSDWGDEDDGIDDVAQEALCVVENLLNESPRLPTLKARRRSLTPEEKREAGDAPIWKATVNGKTWYVCNTHRCYQARPTVKGAVHAWHNGVEQSG